LVAAAVAIEGTMSMVMATATTVGMVWVAMGMRMVVVKGLAVRGDWL
jgi:hypothetical protein